MANKETMAHKRKESFIEELMREEAMEEEIKCEESTKSMPLMQNPQNKVVEIYGHPTFIGSWQKISIALGKVSYNPKG